MKTIGGVSMTAGGISVEVSMTLGQVSMTLAGGKGDGRGNGVFFFEAGEIFMKECFALDFALDFALRIFFLLAAIVVESRRYGVE